MSTRNRSSQHPQDFPPSDTALSLTVRDLLAARDIYHAALNNMPNVIGTALGLYRFRLDAHNKAADRPDFRPREAAIGPRTLSNSRTTCDSQAALLVFVRDWIPYEDLPKDPRYIVPQFLYLRDGRAVPTCVIKLDLDSEADRTGFDASYISFPENLIGGGCGVYSRVQGQEHVGTVACLSTDGERLYGLTARHVAGPAGQPIYTRIRGKERQIGVSDGVQVKRRPFCEMYPEYQGRTSFTNLDAGFVQIEEASWWTSQVLHLGELDDLADLHTANLCMKMIGTRVRASGAVSGDRMKGEITGLFPRYRGMGGADYLADVLIGPRQDDSELQVAGGDSGSLWVLDSEPAANAPIPARVKPVAITWGAVDLAGGGVSRQLVLASFVSTICKALEMELVTGQNIGYRPVWGAENHRTFAAVALGLLRGVSGKLHEFLLGTTSKEKEKRLAALEKLAVLPDDWRYKRGRGEEGPNHYADIDKVAGGVRLAGVPLTPKAWVEFYEDEEKESGEEVKYGALPFRIGQVFDLLVEYLKDLNLEWAYAAAGALIHYVADACNPAHVTEWSKGDPGWTKSQNSRFHSIWDNFTKIDEALVEKSLSRCKVSDDVDDGQCASRDALKLMGHTLDKVKVGDFVDSSDPPASYAACREFVRSPQGMAKIADVVAHGCALLFSLWASAWRLGSGSRIDAQALADIPAAGLYDDVLYDPEFLPSISLKAAAAG
jgi:hypothetical protein